MKRVLALTLCAALALSLLAACSDRAAQETVIPTDPAVTDGPLGDPDPTQEPTPTPSPSAEPSEEPSQEPSEEPSAGPVENPSLKPLPTTPEPASTPKPTPAPTPVPDATPAPEPTPAPAEGVDLSAFYADMTGQYQFGFLELASTELLDGYYAGLSGIAAKQCLVYITQMSMNNGEFGLVQVEDSADVEAVKAIFQARIDYMAGDGEGPGGVWYPGPTEQWKNNSRVVSNGNYVMMVVHENCDDIVAAFNALF